MVAISWMQFISSGRVGGAEMGNGSEWGVIGGLKQTLKHKLMAMLCHQHVIQTGTPQLTGT